MSKSLNEPVASSQPSTSEKVPSVERNSRKEPPVSDESNHKSEITFAAQDKLPKLPIPDLDDTCRKYLDALRPLQNKREQEETAAAVQDFLEHDGPELQARLKRYASGTTSYIEKFCTLTTAIPQILVSTHSRPRVRFILKF